MDSQKENYVCIPFNSVIKQKITFLNKRITFIACMTVLCNIKCSKSEVCKKRPPAALKFLHIPSNSPYNRNTSKNRRSQVG